MPWNLSRRDGKWCVVKQGESDPVPGGCHPDRASAIKHQRALYANESRMASIYDELDAQPDPELEQEPEFDPADWANVRGTSELVKIEIGKEHEALTASMMAQMERMSERQAATDQALVAALQAIGQRESVVNVSSPVSVEPTPITVEAPNVTVESATVNVPPTQITVQPADVNVMLPERQKTVTFERDPLTQQVVKAEVTET